jgi:hypothetical protein
VRAKLSRKDRSESVGVPTELAHGMGVESNRFRNRSATPEPKRRHEKREIDTMLTLMTSILATTLLTQSPDLIVLTGVVVDTAGKPASGVDVMLPARRPPDGSLPTLARTMTDEIGAFRFEIPRQRLKDIPVVPSIWAYRPGGSVAGRDVVIAERGAMPPVRLTLAEPLPRTVTILGPDDRPLAGVGLAPVSYALDGGPGGFQTPDDWLERLTITSGADGVVTLPYFPVTIDPITVRVSGPGIAPHHLGLAGRPGRGRITLKIGRPTRLTGIVYNDSGQPASDVPIEVWVTNTYDLPSGAGETRKATLPASLIHFDPGPVRTQADGSFLTPAQLLTGSSYRIIIRSEGSPPVASDWLTATTELATVPPLRLQQHRKLIGLVHDRQGKPVAGARVFLPSGEPSTTTDAQGHYVLEGVLPEKTYLLVKAEGFRFHGWPGVPAREPQERKLILARTSEPPDRAMVSLPPPISIEESRALARRLLEPSLQSALEKGDLRSKFACLRIASRIEPGRVLELLEQHPLGDASADAGIRSAVATELLTTDPKEAESAVNTIASPGLRSWAYVQLAEALPDRERTRKRGFLEQATIQARRPAVGGDQGDREGRFAKLKSVAEGWLNVGEIDQARPLIREGLELFDALPEAERYHFDFLATAARIESERVLSLVRAVSSTARRRTFYAAITESLANEHPAEAERVFQLIDDSARVARQSRTQIALRLCRRMAKTDPERARRIIAELKTPQDQACGWALLTLGQADRDNPAARSSLAESIRIIDRLLDSKEVAKPANLPVTVSDNPAASILPIVEKVAPERLEEIFWRAVALMPKGDLARQQQGVVDYRVATTAIFLARYDRQVADVFLAQAMSSQSHSRIFYAPVVIRAKAGVDPQGAVAMMEALPQADLDPKVPMNQMTNQAREALIVYLIEPSEDHWKFVWSQADIPLDERRFP